MAASEDRRSLSGGGSAAASERAALVGEMGLAGVALPQQRDALGDLVDELGRALDAHVLAEAQRPGGHLARAGVRAS